jgi:hypothetical protein
VAFTGGSAKITHQKEMGAYGVWYMAEDEKHCSFLLGDEEEQTHNRGEL